MAKKKIAKKKAAKKKVAKKKAKKKLVKKKAVATVEAEVLEGELVDEPAKGFGLMFGGRPSIFQPEVVEEILMRMIEGESLRSICRLTHMPAITTVMRWISEGGLESSPDDKRMFREQYALARELQTEVLFEEALDEARSSLISVAAEDEESRRTSAYVQAHKLIVDTIKWRCGKQLPKKYGELLKLDHSGKVDTEKTVIIKNLTGSELE